jgi:hypothetical protein
VIRARVKRSLRREEADRCQLNSRSYIVAAVRVTVSSANGAKRLTNTAGADGLTRDRSEPRDRACRESGQAEAVTPALNLCKNGAASVSY